MDFNPVLFAYHFENIKDLLDDETQVIISAYINDYLDFEFDAEYNNSIDFNNRDICEFHAHFEKIKNAFPPPVIGAIRRRIKRNLPKGQNAPLKPLNSKGRASKKKKPRTPYTYPKEFENGILRFD